MTKIQVDELQFRYPGTNEPALSSTSIEITKGEAFAILGASGAGKTTLLNLLSGILKPTSGSINFDNALVNTLSSRDRNLAQVFQFPVLYEALSVIENLEFPLKARKFDSTFIKKRTENILEHLEIADLQHRRIAELSLFQKQLVSIGKSLVRPDVSTVLLDEPLTAVEPSMKWKLRNTLRQIQKEQGLTMIYVTHDQTEALTFANRVAVMDKGHILQIDTPEIIYRQPDHKFVGTFIGSPGMNFVSAKTLQSTIQKPEGAQEIGFRPEWAVLSSEQVGDLPGKVKTTQLTGTTLGAPSGITWVSTNAGEIAIKGTLSHKPGDHVTINLRQFLAFQDQKRITEITHV